MFDRLPTLAGLARPFWRRSGRRDREWRARLDTSPFFDRAWYLTRYPDVSDQGIDPLRHYLEHGWREGRDPSASFSTTGYLRANPDVVRAGVNPLVHFIEHGLSEGRGAARRGRQTVPRRHLAESFSPPAPCASYPQEHGRRRRWIRSAELEDKRQGGIEIDGLVIGVGENERAAGAILRAFDDLAELSGWQVANFSDPSDGATPDQVRHSLIDAWYIGRSRLRSRWRATSDPFVVRAYQYDPRNDAMGLVGEALIDSDLDSVDTTLANAFFPVLFVFSDPDANLLDAQLLAFPSLCRGGLHYPELLALSRRDPKALNKPIDILSLSQQLAEGLQGIKRGRLAPAVTEVLIRLDGADATEPLFQPDFRSWLSSVANVGIRPVAGEAAGEFVSATAALSPAVGRPSGACELELSANMVPSISWLAMAAPSVPASELHPVPLVIGGIEPAQPSTLIRPPSHAAQEFDTPGQAGAKIWPSARMSGGASLPPAAVQMPRARALDESELLVPVAGRGLPTSPSAPAISWLIDERDWSCADFGEAVESLSLQNGSSCDEIVVIGQGRPELVTIAEAFFPNRVRQANGLSDCLPDLQTPLVGSIGAGIRLHDGRSRDVLRWLLETFDIATASSVIVSAERRGKGWKVAVADGGHLTQPEHEGEAPSPADLACQLWRSTYPVRRPPEDFWLARTSSVREWQAKIFDAAAVVHACTSLITASYSGERPKRSDRLVAIPESAAVNAVSAELLFG